MLEELLPLFEPIHVADIGAALTNDVPPYQPLLDKGLARLSAFDADERRELAEGATVYSDIIADGEKHTLYLCSPDSGMTSILRPCARGLAFFNGFSRFGQVHDEVPVQSRRLDDVGLAPVDYIKLDIQGAELMALKGGEKVLADCVAVQLEVSFIPLYEGQPSFGEVDLYMRSRGFAPHCFTEVKPWSIAPVKKYGDERLPFNQLLEADVVYIRDPLRLDRMTSGQLRKLIYIAWHCYQSPDLAGRLMLELEMRNAAAAGSAQALLRSAECPS